MPHGARPEAGAAAYRKLRDEVNGAPLLGTRVVELPSTPKRHARTAILEIRALTATIKPPHARGNLPSVTLRVVLAHEVGGPDDETVVSWLLLTSLPVERLEDALRVVDYYVARWTIETYFRVLKTGCKVEEIQLETTAV